MFSLNVTASQTGMRIGELQALQWSDISDDMITVSKSWSPVFGIGPTKNGKTRYVPITEICITFWSD